MGVMPNMKLIKRATLLNLRREKEVGGAVGDFIGKGSDFYEK